MPLDVDGGRRRPSTTTRPVGDRRMANVPEEGFDGIKKLCRLWRVLRCRTEPARSSVKLKLVAVRGRGAVEAASRA